MTIKVIGGFSATILKFKLLLRDHFERTNCGETSCNYGKACNIQCNGKTYRIRAEINRLVFLLWIRPSTKKGLFRDLCSHNSIPQLIILPDHLKGGHCAQNGAQMARLPTGCYLEDMFWAQLLIQEFPTCISTPFPSLCGGKKWKKKSPYHPARSRSLP